MIACQACESHNVRVDEFQDRATGERYTGIACHECGTVNRNAR